MASSATALRLRRAARWFSSAVSPRLAQVASCPRAQVVDDKRTLRDFMPKTAGGGAAGPSLAGPAHAVAVPLPSEEAIRGRQFFVETYGCQMNVSDSEIVR
jgi:hypothetical protein